MYIDTDSYVPEAYIPAGAQNYLKEANSPALFVFQLSLLYLLSLEGE